MTDLPPGWEWTRLGDIADTTLGKMLDCGKRGGHPEVPYLRNVDVQWGRIEINDLPKIEVPEDELGFFSLAEDDLLVCEGGEIGRCAIWPGSPHYVTFQKALHRVRPLGSISSRFLMQVLRWLSNTGRLFEVSTGSTIMHLPQKNLRSLRVPLPPLSEQRRLVAAIGMTENLLDLGNENLRAARERAQFLKSVILQRLIPTSLPEHWLMSTVGESGRVELGLARNPSRHHGPNMKPYLRVANVFEDRFDYHDLKEMNIEPEEFRKYSLHSGDVLLNEGQSPELLGRPALYNGQPDRYAFTNSLLRFKAGPGLLPRWALLMFRRHMHNGRFVREVRITTNIAHLSAGASRPSSCRSRRFTNRKPYATPPDAEFDRIDRLNEALVKTEKRSSHLAEDLLHKALTGQLDTHDSADEPAWTLLERIRTERAAAQPDVRRRRTTPGRCRKA